MSVKFTFGGVKRDLRIELKAASRFEDATGLGFLELTNAISDKRAKLSQVVEVLRVAFDENGTKFTHEEIFDQIRHDKNGIVNAYVVAGVLLMELCMRPEESKTGKKQPAASGSRNASH
jgi:hypothetical protein